MLPKRVIVLGGARSGKSSFAERLMESYNLSKVYLATAQAFDEEMKSRITQHKKSRDPAWRLVETPMGAADALRDVTAQEVVLLDCATMWLSNQMLAETDLNTARAALLTAIAACAGHVVIVSNEVGLSIVPENALARQFRDEQGVLNQQLAAQSDLAVFVAAGLPMVLKGALPAGFA